MGHCQKGFSLILSTICVFYAVFLTHIIHPPFFCSFFCCCSVLFHVIRSIPVFRSLHSRSTDSMLRHTACSSVYVVHRQKCKMKIKNGIFGNEIFNRYGIVAEYIAATVQFHFDTLGPREIDLDCCVLPYV